MEKGTNSTGNSNQQPPNSGSEPSSALNQSGETPLSAKDLKALKKAEKAAKRAAQKAAVGLPTSTDPRQSKQAQVQNTQGGQSGKPQLQNAKGVQSQAFNRDSGATNTNGSGSGLALLGGASKPKMLEKRLTLFGHLDISGVASAAAAGKEVHPSVLYLAMQFSSFHVAGSAERCRTMLLAFKDVIRDYNTPEGTSLSRNLTGHLSHQIDHLKTARPLSISMGNAIRWLKQEIANLGIDLSDAQAKQYLHEEIDNFIRVRLDYADRVIVENAVNNINDGDTILTYASSQVVLATFTAAHKQGKKFKVIVVDSRPLFEGRKVAKVLSDEGISTTYTLFNGLSYALKDVTTVFVGAHAMLSNGMLYSRVGTAAVALLASSRNIPVVVLCQSIKFSDRVLLDSFTFNELGSSDALVNLAKSTDDVPVPSPALKNWREIPSLNVMHALYDVAPPDSIKKVITEVGSLPPSSVPVVLREYKSGY